MKMKITLIVLFFLCMAAVPMLIINKKAVKQEQIGKTIMTESGNLAALAGMCAEDVSDEVLKALAIIAKTNDAAGWTIVDKTDAKADEVTLKRMQTIYHSNNEILTYRNQPVAVPCSLCSNGFTAENKDKEYLIAAASPWDCFCKAYDNNNCCEGVSINGVCHLCNRGLNAEEALEWYLPKLVIVNDEN